MPSIVFSNVAVDLKPAPIKPDWILGGNPVARNACLSTSHDRTATTLVWECTAGSFKWIYDTDETIHILEGSVLLRDGDGPVRRIGPGDVVFFPKGSVAHWQVEGYVRKLAFFRRALPKPVGLAVRAAMKMKSVLKSAPRPPVGHTPPGPVLPISAMDTIGI